MPCTPPTRASRQKPGNGRRGFPFLKSENAAIAPASIGLRPAPDDDVRRTPVKKQLGYLFKLIKHDIKIEYIKIDFRDFSHHILTKITWCGNIFLEYIVTL